MTERSETGILLTRSCYQFASPSTLRFVSPMDSAGRCEQLIF